jgi:hypothetical protein
MLIQIWRALRFCSTTEDISLERALAFILANETSRAEWLALPEAWSDLDWIQDGWWSLVTGATKRWLVLRVHRRYCELCVFTQMMWNLEMSGAYQQDAGIPTEAKGFVAERRRWLSKIAEQTDCSFPDNDAVRIENGEPVLQHTQDPAGVGRRTVERTPHRYRPALSVTPLSGNTSIHAARSPSICSIGSRPKAPLPHS